MCWFNPTEYVCDGEKHMEDRVSKRCHNSKIGDACDPNSKETRKGFTAKGKGYCKNCSARLGLQGPPGRVPVANIGDGQQMRNAEHGGQGGYGEQGRYGVDWGYNTTGGPSGTRGHSETAGSIGTGMHGGYGGQSGTLRPHPGSTEDPIQLDPDRRGGGVSGNAVWTHYGHTALEPVVKVWEDKRKRRADEKRQREDEYRRRQDEKRR